MTNRELMQKIKEKNDEAELLHESKAELQKELDKPQEDWDYDAIDELTRRITILDGSEKWIEKKARNGIRALQPEIRLHCQPKSHRSVWGTAVFVFAALLVCLNVWTYTAFGMNAFTAFYIFTDKGVTVDYNRSTEETIPADTGNPYARRMRYICEDYGYEALIPNYLPEGFEPNPDIEFGHRSISDDPLIITFNFSNTHKHLFRRRDAIVFNIFFYQTDKITPVSFPSDEQNITEQVIDDTVITISKEDDQFHAMFLIDRTLYHLYTSGVDYEEAQQILESVFEEQQAV